MEERYTRILEWWFITEPPLFQVLCIHELVPNTQMSCPLRSGRKKLEYNPDIVKELSDHALEEALRAEAVSDGVTKTTNCLVVKDITSNSSKIQKAMKNGIEILEIDTFREKYL